MKETWRWFGPQDPIPLEQVKQAGVPRSQLAAQAKSPEEKEVGTGL